MEHKIFRKSFALSLAATLATLPNPMLAQSAGVGTKENVSPNSTATYWTPARLQNAKPLVPIAKNQSSVAAAAAPTGTPITSDGKPPTVSVKPNETLLFTPAPAADVVQPNTVGTVDAHFTSSRLVPLSADRTYPYRAVGKLFYTKPGGGDFVCSAAVLKPRVVLTAGHCVHSGNGSSNEFYTNFMFIPAFRDGAAPFGSWTWSFIAVTNTWLTGNGTLPNAADYAMIEFNDRTVNGVVRKIGDLTGFLGFRTLGLIPNHLTLLGYPCNLDNCAKMHQVTAGSFRSVAPNSVEYGSDMTGGSSGGPWVQNFGAAAVGQVNGSNRGRNQVVGITSYGYTNTGPLVQGSSIPDNRFTDILHTVCTHRAGNC